MGDRSNIVIRENNGARIYLYGHWSGEGILRSALVGLKSSRVNDPGYLARIVFADMIAGQEGEELGFGITTTMMDNNYPVLVLNEDETAWLEDSYQKITTSVIPAADLANLLTESATYEAVLSKYKL